MFERLKRIENKLNKLCEVVLEIKHPKIPDMVYGLELTEIMEIKKLMDRQNIGVKELIVFFEGEK